MLIKVIDTKAASAFLDWLKEASATQAAVSVLHFRFSATDIKPTEKSIVDALAPLWNASKVAVYLLDERDAIIVWGGAQSAVVEQVVASLYRHFDLDPARALHHYYDLQAHTEALRQLAHEKLTIAKQAVAEKSIATPPVPQTLTAPSDEELKRFHRAASTRAQRLRPHILIVEDLAFARKLLLGLLDKDYPCNTAADAVSAFALHLEKAPDILLLDIELPHISGHALATAIRQFDEQVQIIMVTGNNYADDVYRARMNAAKGYIVKPFSKQKILEVVHACHPSRKM